MHTQTAAASCRWPYPARTPASSQGRCRPATPPRSWSSPPEGGLDCPLPRLEVDNSFCVVANLISTLGDSVEFVWVAFQFDVRKMPISIEVENQLGCHWFHPDTLLALDAVRHDVVVFDLVPVHPLFLPSPHQSCTILV